MRDCGLENFTIEIIETCESLSQAHEKEKFWISVLKSKTPYGYNQSDGGEGGYQKLSKIKVTPTFNFITTINTELSIGELIMRYAKLRGFSQTALREEYNRRFGTNYIQPSFSRKLTRGIISWDELNQFGKILGFKVELVSTD